MSYGAASKYLVSIIILLLIILVIVIIAGTVVAPRITGQAEQAEFTRLCYQWSNENCEDEYYEYIGTEEDPTRLKTLCEKLYPSDLPPTSSEAVIESKHTCQQICLNNCNPILPNMGEGD